MSAHASAGKSQRALTGDRSARARIVLLALLFLLLAASLLSLAVGATGLMPLRSLGLLLGISTGNDGDPLVARDALVLIDIRLPRMVFALLTGAALATAGCVMQGVFRNPLADPGLIGTASGAALAAVATIVLGDALLAQMPPALRVFALPGAAFAGALAATAILYVIATRQGQTAVATMLLAGIALAALASAAIGLLIFVSDERQLRDLTFWTLGSLGGATWPRVAALSPIVLAALFAFWRHADRYDALLLGEADARYLGTDVERVKRTAIIAVAGAVGGTVGMTGVIGFVGIVVPHLLRLLIGPLHRGLLPACALCGAALTALADTACRTLVAPAELPIGILTALFGAPFFLWLLIRRRALAGA